MKMKSGINLHVLTYLNLIDICVGMNLKVFLSSTILNVHSKFFNMC